jgi:hypothetical protein
MKSPDRGSQQYKRGEIVLLEKACEQRYPLMVCLSGDRIWDPLLPEPRFQEILRRMNFPK